MSNEMSNEVSWDILYYLAILVLVCIIIGIFYYLFHENEINEKFEVKYKKKVDSFKQKIEILESKINEIENELENEIENEPLLNKEKELFEMFYKGIPDTYDLDGNLIKGVEPNAIKAIYYLQKIINSPYKTENDVLKLARIYHYGMHLFERDLDKAEEIYSGLKFDNTTSQTLTIIKEALNDIQKIRVYNWLNLPLERPSTNPDFNTPATVITPALLTIQNRPRIRTTQTRQTPIWTQDRATNLVDKKEYNDPQNTHNPQVLSTIRLSLENLKATTPVTKSQGVVITEIKEYLNKLKESDKKQDALKSLKIIENNTEHLSNTNMSEIDALTLVWNRINDSNKFSQEISDNLKETMFDELASMQEFGTTICSTGRFTHIIDTLNGVDEEVSIKPTYAINEEMMTKSAKIREDLLNAMSDVDREQFEKGTSPVQDEFDTNLKRTIITKLKEDYVNTGILTESKFTVEINKWIDYI